MEEYTQITLDEWMQWKEDIRRKLEETSENFVYIGYRLKQIRDSGMFNGAADIFEFAQKEYGLGKSTVSRFIAINEKYSEGGNSLELKAEYKAFSSSKLAEMLTLPDIEIELITEKTTIREIRDLKSFNQQSPEPETMEEQNWSPLEKCLIDYFESRSEMLNQVMKCLGEEEPQYKEAAELMNPSGQSSHKKGILFLFLYDWQQGIKYKLLTQPDPVSMSWPELLNNVYRIYASCSQKDVWKAFYSTAEKPEETQKNQGLEHAVATSQQTEDDAMEEESETEENESKIEESENDSEENDNDLARNEPETEKTEPEEEQMDDSEDEESETGIPEEIHEAAAVDEPEEIREDEKTEGDEVSSLVERIAEESMDIARLLKNREVRTVLQYKTIAIDAKTLVKHIETLIKLVS